MLRFAGQYPHQRGGWTRSMRLWSRFHNRWIGIHVSEARGAVSMGRPWSYEPPWCNRWTKSDWGRKRRRIWRPRRVFYQGKRHLFIWHDHLWGRFHPRPHHEIFHSFFLQIYSRKVPFFKKRNDSAVIFSVIGGKRPELPHELLADEVMSKLVYQCWDQDSKLRPTITQVLKVLGNNTVEDNIVYYHRFSSLMWSPTQCFRHQRNQNSSSTILCCHGRSTKSE